jgi:hypothetical protein
VFTTAEEATKPYTEIALLESRRPTSWLDSNSGQIPPDMINTHRKKAASLGANGLILGSFRDPSDAAKIWNFLFDAPAYVWGTTTAIYMPQDTARVREACAQSRD